MYNKKLLGFLVFSIASGASIAVPEISGKFTHESATYTNNGKTIGLDPRSGIDNNYDDHFKGENSLRVNIDGTTENSSYHVELQGYHNSQDPTSNDDWTANEAYTQRDPLREAYVDTNIKDWQVRFGKQQVVWGTADGMKLLDAINPTDYSEMAQNQMEDSRIPVWMLNSEKSLENGGNFQFIVSEGRSNIMPGLGQESLQKRGGYGLDGSNDPFVEHQNGSKGHPFMLKGVDTITGQRNGFLNIGPALGTVAQSFDRGAYYGSTYVSLQGYTRATVDDFASNYQSGDNQSIGFAGFCDGSNTNADCLSKIVNNAYAPNGASLGAFNDNEQNLMDVNVTAAQWTADKDNPNYVIAYMPDATFATFDAFVNMKSKYVVDHELKPTTALKYSNTTKGGSNYSFNFIHGSDPNPYIEMEWQDQYGTTLYETAVADTTQYDVNGNTYVTNQLKTADGQRTVGGKQIGSKGNAHMHSDQAAVLVMKEKLNTITQVGGSFDTSIDTEALGPIVIRAEGLYQKDVMSPVLTRRAADGKDLNHGFLVSSLKMEKGDRFKYVIGADITAMTNMMVSLQFIQDRNLDYINEGHKSAQTWKYTADMATMHLTNNLQAAEENKEFYSLFLSKPFGESGQHRWNNIFMFEENGGKWNRLDIEYTFNDNTVLTGEYNNYWGNENTQFGQLKESSNVQVGVKYLF